jgi:hypothetical protein
MKPDGVPKPNPGRSPEGNPRKPPNRPLPPRPPTLARRKPPGRAQLSHRDASRSDTGKVRRCPETGDSMPAPADARPARPVSVTALRRNEGRLHSQDDQDSGTLGKSRIGVEHVCISDRVSDLFRNTLKVSDNWFVPPPWLLANLRAVVNLPVQTPLKPPTTFDTSPEAIAHNTKLLADYSLDFVALMGDLQATTVGYNSEFRPVSQLRLILGDHPHFPYLEEMAKHGMEYKFSLEITEDERVSKLTAMVARGNHKLAEAASQVTAALFNKDVRHGFSFAFDPSVVPRMPHALVQPCGMVLQHTLQEDGSRVEKSHLTQDLSFSTDDRKLSVNSRTDLSEYPDMVYGWCLLRKLHCIVALRWAFPDRKIFISKWDFSDAYRIIVHAAMSAVQSVVIFSGIAYLALRMTFGGSANPPAWCAFSEVVTDLANEIALCVDFDPDTLASPDYQPPAFRILDDDDEPPRSARELAVPVPTTLTSRCDCFIDDIIQVFLDSPDNRHRQPAIVPLAVFATMRPHAGDAEPVLRRPLLSPSKVAAEGAPAELQIVLGWELHTRRLTIGLPLDKFLAWTLDLDTTILARSVIFAELESIVGRLNHASFVMIPLSRHFVYRLRRRLTGRRAPKQRISLTTAEIDNLSLWKVFLVAARDRISMNRVVTRRPTRVSLSDSCPFGLGGFLLSGRAWRLRIPAASPLRGDSRMNNVLEFLAMAISIWLQVLDTPDDQDCILALADSTSAIGWLY